MFRPASSLVFRLVLILLAVSSLGAVLPRMTLEDLSRRAEVIALGTVIRSQSRWTEDRQRIVTDHVLHVETVLKGRERPQLVITTQGGVVGDVGEAVPGAAAFHPGDRAIVFLAPLDGDFRVVGWSQGSLRVVRDGAGEEMVVSSLEGAVLADPSGRVSAPEPAPPRRLSAVLDEILAAAAPGER